MSWTRFFQRRARREESAAELEAYLEAETQDNIERGMPPAEARRAAHIKLGNVTNILGNMAQQDSVSWLETLWQDVRYGFRMLLKHRGFALVSLLTLALGIGANTAIFTVVDATLIRPLPFPNANRVVMAWEHRMPDGERQNVTSPATFLRWQQDNTVFDQMAAIFNDSSILSGGDVPEQIATASVSPNFFSILGVNAALGRVFVPEQDGKSNSNRVAVLSFDTWQRRFASDPGVLGQAITLDDKPYTVVGVMPRGFDFFVKQGSFSQKKPQIWVAMNFSPENRTSHGRYLQAIGLLRQGVTLGHAQDAMLSLQSRLEAEDPASMKNWSVNLVPLRAQLTGEVAQGLRLLLAAVGMVLLIACANVATLNLARASARRHEIAIRMALGAAAKRVVRQVLTESCLLSLMGGAAGFCLGYLCLAVLKSIAPANLIPLDALRLDWRVFAFATAVSVLSGLLFGTIPALDAARTAPREPLQEGAGTVSSGENRGVARRILVVSEIAIALVLLMGASLLIRSFYRIVAVDPGFRPQNVLTAWVQFPNARYQKDEQKNQFFERLLDSVRAIPGVRSASADGFLPFAGIIAATAVQVEGRPVLPISQLPVADVSLVEPGFFETLGIPLISGRTFNQSEAFQATGNVVISQSMAQTLWPHEDPIGKRVTIYMKRDNKPSTVIGVVGDVKHAGLASAVRPTAYWSYPELGFQFMTLVIRTDGDPRAFIPALREAVLRIDKDQPLADVVPMETLLSMSVARTRFATQVMAAFALIAFLLAIVGIYGVVSYDVEQRGREIGIRIALGAQRAGVIGLMLKRGMVLAGIGIGLGIAASLGLTRLLTSVLYQTRPNEPILIALDCAALAMVSLFASYIAVRRITRIDPMAMLRRE
ncbi:ABC transporter permease [Occallatibacter riparius]|uniref:ABC transporter permease n=1 Tax=Occallatibacter riparius TaxID=1002689 RepID=A0A9J7BPH1_9BACT|nr:ABC transporter permease [Occallatibacter riparius]UWZ84780.1 ABC transporter permease [Occallatibacter riparius]